jgi:hypothetical protein
MKAGIGGRLLIVSLLGMTGFALAGTAFAEDDSNPTITVLVSNYFQASPAIVGRAESEASRIMEKAGVRVVWFQCPMGPVDAKDPCQRAPEATDIRLRVLAAPIQGKFIDTVFGFTFHPVLASVYYDSVVRRAKSDDADFEIPIILGGVIAHELGHLLLGPKGHAGAGIMRTRWEPGEVEQILKGNLLFTAAQSKQMREQARVRMTLRREDAQADVVSRKKAW